METKQLTVQLGERSYPIWIGSGLIRQVGTLLLQLGFTPQTKMLIVTDEHVGARYLEPVRQGLLDANMHVLAFTVPAGERSKSFTYYERVLDYALQQHLDRKSVILALGGGVVGDLAGFVASTLLRGIAYVQIPTTILAHDSSVGGKVAINHATGKNLIGAFHQPRAVIYDTETLHTLPDRDVTSGFAEVLKHGFIRDESLVDWLEEHRNACCSLQEPYISEALYQGCHIKANVVADDETEQNVRAILNFGHTFGHAIEALGGYGAYTHGEAISIGMVLAARLSEKLYNQSGLRERIARLLYDYGLPADPGHLPWSVEDVLTQMYTDKKVTHGNLNMVVLRRMGEACLAEDVPAEIVREVLLEEGMGK